jgi:hypothetical protein
MTGGASLRKRLTANDIGTTGSHQAGMHIPKTLVDYFPPLKEETLNPSVWLNVAAARTTYRWRFVHYNNGVVRAGTRDEYRITFLRGFFRSEGTREGDIFELESDVDGNYQASILRQGQEGEVLVLRTSGPWTLIRYRRSRESNNSARPI